jgi:hypothetical protein
LVLKFEEKLSILHAVKCAKDLASVIDELTFLNVDLQLLQREFTSCFPEHWKRRTSFLLIVTKFWPEILKELGREDVVCNYGFIHRNISIDNEVSNIVEKINICEVEDIFHEIDFAISLILSNQHIKMAIVSPDTDVFQLLKYRIKIENIPCIEIYNNNKILNEIEIYFGEMISKNDHEFTRLVCEISDAYLPYEVIGNNDNIMLTNNINALDQSKFDILICMSMNEMAWCPHVAGKYWLHQSIRQRLNLPTQSELALQTEGHFYELVRCSEKVFLTRSKKVSGQHAKKNAILAKFEAYAKKEKCKLNYCDLEKEYNQKTVILNDCSAISSFIIPNRLSINSLEFLLRNQYGFFVSNILGLRSSDTNHEMEEISAAFEAMKACLYDDTIDIDRSLDAIKRSNFFYYQQLLITLSWMRSHNRTSSGMRNVFGSMAINGIEIYGRLEIVKTFGDYSELSSFKAFAPASTKELLYGAHCSLLAACLIAEKGGFPDLSAPIRTIKIYSQSLHEDTPFSVKTLEVTGDLLLDFEIKIEKFLQNCSRGISIPRGEAGNYWHLERCVR